MDTVPKALMASAVIVAVALIVAADFLSSRYQITGIPGGLYRLDRFTGAVTLCTMDTDNEQLDAAMAAKIGVTAHCDIPERTKAKAANSDSHTP